MSGGMIQDGIRVLGGSNLRFHFQRFQIEDGNLGGPAFADETNAEVGSYSDAMYAGRVGDVTNDGAALRIQYGHMRGARNVNAVRFWIDGDVVPAPAPFERNLFHDFEFAAVITSAQCAGC